MRLKTAAVLFTGLGLSLVPDYLCSQEPSSRTVRRVPVTVALSPSALQSGEKFLIRRNPAPRDDVILLAPDAAAVDLADAVEALVQIRRATGDVAASSKAFRLRPSPQNRRSGNRMGWTRRVVRDIQVAEQLHVQGMGFVRALKIWLPRQASQR